MKYLYISRNQSISFKTIGTLMVSNKKDLLKRLEQLKS